jgi:hypothetical protein
MGQDSHNDSNKVRNINANDIALPHGSKIDVFAEGLTEKNGHHEYIPETGVIWKVIRV